MKRLFSLLMALVLVLSLTVSAHAADGNVTYYKNAKAFIFLPGSEESPTDLFPNFKDVMPGDSLEQRILVKNDASNKVGVKLYMRALGAHEDSVEFLSQLQLTVTKTADTVLFEAPADQTAQLTDWVYLGTLKAGGECELMVKLDVPVTLDNEFKQMVGYLDWEFAVEEMPRTPQTGDPAPVWLWILLLVASAGAIVLLIVLRRRKDQN